MFDFVQEKKRIVQVVMFLIIVAFAFFGVDTYKNSGGLAAPATVNGEKISQQELDNALRQQMERVREQAGANFDPGYFEKPEIKRVILDNLISQRLLSSQARSVGLTLSDAQMAQIIDGFEAFRKDGKFDRQRYIEVLAAQKMTPLIFQSRVTDDVITKQLVEAYIRNGYASQYGADNLIRLNEQQRVVSVSQFTPDLYTKQLKVEEVAVKEYFDKNQKEFKTPESARVEYLIFSVSALLSQVSVSDAEIKEYYQKHQPEFSTPKLIKAAHIQIEVGAKASEADWKVAKVKAGQVLLEVKQAPAQFAQLAQKYSQDPGSASNGGNLGMFGRGMMGKPFDDVAFKLLVGEISDLVQSDFGFHIIKVLGIKGGVAQEFNEVKSTIAQKLKTQKANEKYAELAEKFSNAVYEQSDSLKPAADLVKLPLLKVDWINKGQIGVSPWTDKALQAVFSDEAIKNKRNTPAIEIAPNTLLAARVLEHKQESVSPLAEVAATIRQKLQRQQAQSLVVNEGKSILAKLQQGAGAGIQWKGPQTVTRSQHSSLDNDFTRKIFQADASKLPAYVGMENSQGGYSIARIDSIKEVDSLDDVKRARYLQQLRQITGEELLQSYIADIKKNASINIATQITADKNN